MELRKVIMVVGLAQWLLVWCKGGGGDWEGDKQAE